MFGNEVAPQFQLLNGFNAQSLSGGILGTNDPGIFGLLGSSSITPLDPFGTSGGLFSPINVADGPSLPNVVYQGWAANPSLVLPVGQIGMAPIETFASSGTSELANLQGIRNGLIGMNQDQLNSLTDSWANLINQQMLFNPIGW